ncbi:uroporphyrinogen-III synthase [Niallia sp. Krafla_26]|uniref:uroporphyrinogen-III synthase n=1 Tax=Niallia sp. Krafla_26 TaxID=3064703 RepID=UPI003D183DC5
MGNGLAGKHVVLGATRKTDEMMTLIQKQGGTASVRSLQGTVFKAGNEIEKDIRAFVENGADWAIITTGIGLETLLEQTDKLGLHEKFIEQLSKTKIASRGYKTTAALKRLNLQAVVSDDDGTTQNLIHKMQDLCLENKKIVVQLHGEKAPSLIEFLETKGAHVTYLLPYIHVAPEQETLERVCDEILNNKVDAVCFTTAIQVHWLLDFAKKKEFYKDILSAFNEGKTIATAVGKVTAAALKEEGVRRLVVPKHERMGAMIVELAQFFDRS